MNDRKSMIKNLKSQGIIDEKVLEAIKNTPREGFVLPEFKNLAYEDRALPIISNQTISQPYTVAFMLQNLNLKTRFKSIG